MGARHDVIAYTGVGLPVLAIGHYRGTSARGSSVIVLSQPGWWLDHVDELVDALTVAAQTLEQDEPVQATRHQAVVRTRRLPRHRGELRPDGQGGSTDIRVLARAGFTWLPEWPPCTFEAFELSL
jgi:hypothetical protein